MTYTVLLQVDQLGMVGTNGKKFPDIRQHLVDNIGKVYRDMDTTYVECFHILCIFIDVSSRLTVFNSFDAFPEGDVINPEACL